jgi:hypothetical protein
MTQIIGKEIKLVMIVNEIEYDLSGYVIDFQMNADYCYPEIRWPSDMPYISHQADPRITVTFSSNGPVIRRALGINEVDEEREDWSANFQMDGKLSGYLDVDDNAIFRQLENGDDDDDEDYMCDWDDDPDVYTRDVVECACGQENDINNEHCCFCGAELLI